jgi:hypothetical protein
MISFSSFTSSLANIRRCLAGALTTGEPIILVLHVIIVIGCACGSGERGKFIEDEVIEVLGEKGVDVEEGRAELDSTHEVLEEERVHR